MIIEPKTIKTYQPYLCPSGLDNSDKDWCAKDPKPIDYGKFLKVFSPAAYSFWRKPVEVRFAEAAKPVLESGVCYDVLPTSRDSLSTIIGEKKSDAGTWPPLPEAHEIYRLLIADPYGQPTDAKNRLTERTKRKAEKIHDGIKRARELEDKGKTAEAQKIRLDLASEIDRVCVEEDGPDKSLLMKNEGQSVIDKYQAAQENYLKAKAWLAGKIALVAVAAWGLAKTGVLGKMRRAFKQTWAATKPPQDGGPVKRFIRNVAAFPGRFLKSAWAAIRIKEGIPPDETTPPPEGGTAPAGTASATDTGNGTQPARPPETLPIKEGASDENVRRALSTATNSAGLLAAAAREKIDDSNEGLLTLSDELSQMTDDRLKFGRLSFLLRSKRTLDFVSSLYIAYMRRVFDALVPKAISSLTYAAELIDINKQDEAKSLLETIKTELSVASTERNELDAIRSSLSLALQGIEKLAEVPDDDFRARSESLLSEIDGLIHDSGTILDVLQRIALMAEGQTPETMAATLKARGLAISNINGIFDAAKWINSHEATRRGGVEFVTSIAGNGNLPVPLKYRAAIVRLVDKATNNCVRHAIFGSERGKIITLTSELLQGGVLMLSVRDNGSGMTDKKVQEIVERPKVGSGISEMMRICNEIGGIFEISSEPGHGTTVTFKFDTSRWSDNGSSSVAGTPPAILPPVAGGSPAGMGGALAFAGALPTMATAGAMMLGGMGMAGVLV